MSKCEMDAEGLTKEHVPVAFQRSDSMDVDRHVTQHANMKASIAGPPPAYPRSGSYRYPPHYAASRPPHPIKSVVTTSFEEREDTRMDPREPSGSFPHQHDYFMPHGRSPPHHGSGRDEYFHTYEGTHHSRETEPAHYANDGRDPPQIHERDPPHHPREQDSYARELPSIQEAEDAERRHPPHDSMRQSRIVRVPSSPREHSLLHRSHSAEAPLLPTYRGHGPLKRSFWHHARSGDDYQSVPNEFMPPKRSKMGPGGRGRDYVVTARPNNDDMYTSDRHVGPSPARSPGWFNRALSWEASREDYYHRDSGSKMYPPSPWSRSPPYRDGGVGPHWSDAPSMPSPRPRYGQNEGYDVSPGGHWNRWHHHEEHPWSPPQNRDETESKHMPTEGQEREGWDAEMRRQGTFESNSDVEPPMRFVGGPPRVIDSERQHLATHRPEARDDKNGPIRLLALPDDRISLSETLCLVRENIEVFSATVEDVEAPAPGRKHAVVVGQVGLRCVHCRHTTRSSERVKRAVCYPSSIKRIYRTVIDMKLDHFLHCKFVPDSLKDTLKALKANNTRSTGTTMQYFIRAAGSLGMVDGPSGVRLVENSTAAAPMSATSPPSTVKSGLQEASPSSNGKDKVAPLEPGKNAGENTTSGEFNIHRNNSLTSESSISAGPMEDIGVPKELFMGRVPLALPEDTVSLSPLRCFLREQVCAFAATEEDIAVRTPTTFSVSVGQVGIGCIHCLNQPAKLRLNRAVCFPFSIARIYQSVADIQRFHLGECKLVPQATKEEFIALQSASSKGSKGLATRQYWVTSAKKIGLVDTAKGIRFGRDPATPEDKPVSLDILAQVASHVTTVNRPLVLPEDKPYIAEFLYVVMEQLQPCRFTEADRNKRRLKDVGCIGVECKHCAGQVEGRKFFWSSVNAVESNFVSVHTHMMECRSIPEPLKEQLAELKQLRKEQTALLKTGSQKAFFSRVWERLHSGIEQAQKESEAKEAEEAGADENKPCQQAPPPTAASVEDKGPEKPTGGDRNGEARDAAPSSPATEKLKIVSDKMAVVSV